MTFVWPAPVYDVDPVTPQVDELVGVLNASNITSTTEVVVAPPSVYLHGVSQKLRGDVKVRRFAHRRCRCFRPCAACACFSPQLVRDHAVLERKAFFFRDDLCMLCTP